jgi:hypothetical protein
MAVQPPSCVYCTIADGLTRDHVPPKSFFPTPRPANLVTVPACLKCNQGAGRDEDYFLATLMFSEAGVTPAGKKVWVDRLHRSYQKNVGLRRKIANSLQHRQIFTPAGIYIGRGMTIEYDEARLERVVLKIVRGLYFREQGVPLDPTAEVTCLFVREREHYEAIKQHNHMLRDSPSRWKGIFQYRCGFVPNAPIGSMWLLWFWETHIFWVVTCRAGTKAAVRAKEAQETTFFVESS